MALRLRLLPQFSPTSIGQPAAQSAAGTKLRLARLTAQEVHSKMPWRIRVILLTVALAVALPSVARAPIQREKPSPSDVQKNIAQCRVVAEAVLKEIESSRNALAKPGRWGQPYRPPEIKSWRDLKFDDPPVPLEEMTYEEKLLILGRPKESWAELMPRQLAQMAYRQYDYGGLTTPEPVWLYSYPVGDSPRLREYLASLISPVTGKLIEVNHQEFSPGNAYVRVVTPDEVRELVKLDPSVDEWWNYAVVPYLEERLCTTLTGKEVVVDRGYGWKREPCAVYVRIYGEKRVLTEGLL